MTVDVGTATAVVAAVAAVVAAWFSFRSAQAARRANVLAEREHAARQANVDVYLVRGVIHRFRSRNVRIYDLQIRFTNRSDAPIGITELLLEIEYSRDREQMPRLQVPARPDAASLLPSVSSAPLRTPLMVDARASVEGAAVFEVSRDLLRDMRIDRHHVVGVDARGNRWTATSIGLNETEHT